MHAGYAALACKVVCVGVGVRVSVISCLALMGMSPDVYVTMVWVAAFVHCFGRMIRVFLNLLYDV